EALAQRYAGERIYGFELLAGLLIRSEAIVAVARGGAEFGPRALGHRSFLAAAHKGELKARLNRLKHRKWYRPCAPIVAREDLELLFQPGPDLVHGIPYMSFAPPLQKWVEKWLPGITHLDGTARPQSVDEVDDPWMHSLLAEVRQEMAQKFQDSGRGEIPHKVGVLINTSLNPKGMPIASDPMDILQLFCAPGGHELDFVLLEETWLIERRTAMLAGLCEHHPSAADAVAFPDGLPVI
ncbi:tobZ, partial [Symbiodinium sp. CCMP2592]